MRRREDVGKEGQESSTEKSKEKVECRRIAAAAVAAATRRNSGFSQSNTAAERVKSVFLSSFSSLLPIFTILKPFDQI